MARFSPAPMAKIQACGGFKMALKFYVSLPMAYHQKTVRKRYDKAIEEIRKEYPNALIYGPTNIDDFDENG